MTPADRPYPARLVRAAEAALIADGVPLMARAAAGLAAVAREALASRDSHRVLVLAGSGDNGGDALFAGAELAGDGIRVSVLRTGSRVHNAGLAAAVAAGAAVLADNDPLPEVDVILDGMTGTGATPPLRARAAEVVAALRPVVAAPGGPAVIAVDLPSGVDPDTGDAEPDGVLRADITVTFGALKSGLLRVPGSEVAGDVRLVDIGLLPELERLAGLKRLAAAPEEGEDEVAVAECRADGNPAETRRA